jgi:hypothetical protein
MNFIADSAMKCFASRCGASVSNALTLSCSALMLDLSHHIQLPPQQCWSAPQ